MLQRILAGFTTLPGVDQAYVISKRDGLVAAVGKRNRVPELEHATKLVEAMESLSKKAGIGRCLELWSEGGGKLMLSRISEDASLILSGKKGGRIARWRHSVDCDVDMLVSVMR